MTLTLQEKIGQMLMFGWTSNTDSGRLTIGGEASWLIGELRVGSVILMSENISDSDQLCELTASLQKTAERSGLQPLFISTDQEGGRVTRLKHPPFRKTREAWEIGESGDPKNAFDETSAIGKELNAHGINWALAPVLDVNNNPANPVIGRRSYSPDPKVVAEFGVEAVRGFQEYAGILACGKHFPGHGDVSVDSHLELPVVKSSLDELRTLELLPFRRAIEAGIGSIMSAHILLPKIDPNHPATLSPQILTDVLRIEMGFNGLIVTDCLQMHAISKRYSPGPAAVLAVKAGADVVLAVSKRETQLAIRDALIGAVENGEISEQRIDESVGRVAAAKEKYVKKI